MSTTNEVVSNPRQMALEYVSFETNNQNKVEAVLKKKYPNATMTVTDHKVFKGSKVFKLRGITDETAVFVKQLLRFNFKGFTTTVFDV
jgi:hypothetical protein